MKNRDGYGMDTPRGNWVPWEIRYFAIFIGFCFGAIYLKCAVRLRFRLDGQVWNWVGIGIALLWNQKMKGNQ